MTPIEPDPPPLTPLDRPDRPDPRDPPDPPPPPDPAAETRPRSRWRDYPLTVALLVVLSVWYLITVIGGTGWLEPQLDALLRFGANYGPLTTGGEGWRLITCTFLHLGVLHFGVNAWALWNLGRMGENLLGSRTTALVYAVSGVAGSLASTTMNPFSIGGGASGALFGLMGAMLGLLLARRDVMPAPLTRALRTQIFTFLVLNGLLAFQISSLDIWAHLGGFIGGAITAWAALHGPVPLGWVPSARRLISIGAVFAVLMGAWFLALPRYPDVIAALTDFESTDARLAAEATKLLDGLKTGTIAIPDGLAAIDRTLVPAWEQLAQRLEIGPVSDADYEQLLSTCRGNIAKRLESLAQLRERLLTADAGGR